MNHHPLLTTFGPAHSAKNGAQAPLLRYGWVWYPKLAQNLDFVNMYANLAEVDVVFSDRDNKEYPVHGLVLEQRCRGLYRFAAEAWVGVASGHNDGAPIALDATSVVIKQLFEFIYTVCTPNIDTKEEAMELLRVADKYDCVHLKLYVESVLVDVFLDSTTAATLWLLADSHSCAYLKEASICLFVWDIEAQDPSWPMVAESLELMREIIFALPNPNQQYGKNVASLRYELEKAGLGFDQLDGSKDMLVDRWKALKARSPEDEDSIINNMKVGELRSELEKAGAGIDQLDGTKEELRARVKALRAATTAAATDADE